MDFFRTFFEAFIPLFVSIDAFGLVPLFLAVTGNLTPARRRALSFEAVLWATIFSIGFMFLGAATFRFLGITGADFKIAGGVLLLVLAVLDLVSNPTYGYSYTSLSLAANFLILLAALLLAGSIARLVGINTLRAFSKVVMILLAAIAVNLIRTGIIQSMAEFRQ